MTSEQIFKELCQDNGHGFSDEILQEISDGISRFNHDVSNAMTMEEAFQWLESKK